MYAKYHRNTTELCIRSLIKSHTHTKDLPERAKKYANFRANGKKKVNPE